MAFFKHENPYGPPSVPIEPTPDYMAQLRSMAHHKSVLVKNAFVVNPLSLADVEDKKRCRLCSARCSNKKNKFKPDAKDDSKRSNKTSQSPPAAQPKRTAASILDSDNQGNDAEKEERKPDKPVLKCQYHTGRVFNMHWSCCRNFVAAPGCTFAPEHITHDYSTHDLLARYQYHKTPPSPLLDLEPPPLISLLSTESYSGTSSGLPRQPRRAVAIDCEMGVAFDGESELIRLTLVDYFTAEILLDSLVYPQVRMQHYNTRYSGVSRQGMENAYRKGKCLMGGLAEVRAEVWRWVGPETVVIGHAVHNDFASLRWIHPLVIDSFILAATAKAEKEKRDEEEEEARQKDVILAAIAASRNGEEDLISFEDLASSTKQTSQAGNSGDDKPKPKAKSGGGLSLKNLTRELLGRAIQVGNRGHDSLEDALAARDLVHWHVIQKFTELQAKNGSQNVMGFW